MKSRRSLSVAAVAIVAAGLVAGGGAAVYAALSPSGTKTVVRQVTVRDSQPAATTQALSVNEIYRRTYKGAVEITVTSQGSSPSPVPFGGARSRGSKSGV